MIKIKDVCKRLWSRLPVVLLLMIGVGVGHGLMSCSSEDTTPSNADTDRLETLIDRSIPAVSNFCDQYGTYLLYDFDQTLDFAYQFQQSTNWNNAAIERLSKVEAAEAAEFLMRNFFCCYSDAFKEKYLPRKMLLVKSIKALSLGIAEPDENGFVQAAANINSMSIAFDKAAYESFGEEAQTAYKRCLHNILLGGYLINVRSEYPADDKFIIHSQSYYSSLMDPNRVQARHLPEEFFLNRGFFPVDDESTYFISAEEDMIVFTRNLINMDATLQDKLADYPIMENKLSALAIAYQNMGVDVAAINPLAKYYLEMNEAAVLPTITTDEVLTPTATADFTFTVMRGSRMLSKAEVWVNGQLQHLVDYSAEGNKARIATTVKLTELNQETNVVEVKVYEESRPRPSAVATTVAYRVSKPMCMIARNSNGEQYYLYVYDYDYTSDKSVEGVSSIRFRKSPTEIDYSTGEEKGGDHRFWVIYKENGLVTKIVVKQEVVDYVALSNSYETRYTYYFDYNDVGELTEVKLDDKTLVSHVSYSNGQLSEYQYGNKTYKPVYDNSVSPALRVDCLDSNLSGYVFQYTGEEMLNYYYLPWLPAVIPGSEAGIPLQFLYSKYLFTRLYNPVTSESVWTNKWLLEGNSNMTEVTLGDVTWTYRFVLQ